MSISLTAEAIIFSINAAIKLGRNTQRAYARSIKSKSIVLPLPMFDATPNIDRAHRFFEDKDEKLGGHQFVAQIEQLGFLFARFDTHGLLPDQGQAYIEYYQSLRGTLQADQADTIDDSRLNADDLVSLLRIRQWEQGRMPKNRPLQLIAGTLVELGIDYFSQVPGALNTHSSMGKAMRSFLSAIDDIPFSDSDEFKEMSATILPKLFISAAEVMGDLSADLSSDVRLQRFIQTTSKGIAEDVFKRMKDLRGPAATETVEWGQLLLRSMVKNAGNYVCNASSELFDTNEGGSQLIRETGLVLLDAILADPHQLGLKQGFNVETMDKLVAAALRTTAEHPHMISNKDGIRQIISSIAQAMADSGIRRPDLLPELARLILAQSAEHLPLLWHPGQENGQHLLVLTVRQLMMALSQPTTGEGTWRPQLSKGQILGIAENLFDEVVRNPQWIKEKANERPMLRQTLDVTFAALGQVPKDERFSTEVLQYLIQLNIRTVATNQAVLNTLKWADDQRETAILHKALDLVFAALFQQESIGKVQQIAMMTHLLDYVMETIVIQHPNEKGLLLIDMVLFRYTTIDYSQGFNRALSDDLINATLGVLNEHPQLATKHGALQPIISGVAGALDSSQFRDPMLLPELLRLVMLHTGRNMDLVLNADTNTPRYLLVSALQQMLAVLSTKPAAGQWQPHLSNAALLGITESLFDQLVQRPDWLVPTGQAGTPFGAVVESVFGALRQLPPQQRLAPGTLELVLQTGMRAAIVNPALLQKIAWGSDAQEATILNKAFDLLFARTFGEASDEEAGGMLADWLAYISEVALMQHPDSRGLALIDLVLFRAPHVNYGQGFNRELADALIQSGLSVMQTHPQLVAHPKSLQAIAAGVAAALDVDDFRSAGLMPALLRLALEQTGRHAALVLDADTGSPRYLAVVAMQQLLGALSTQPAEDHWRPQWSPAQLLPLTEALIGHLSLHPQWIIAPAGSRSIWEDMLGGIFATLASMPEGQRLNEHTVARLLNSSLRAAASSPALLQRVQWMDDTAESTLLNKALDMVFAYAYPAEGAAVPDALALLDDMLAYTLSELLPRHPDKKGLLLLHLVTFQDPQAGILRQFARQPTETLVDAGLLLLSKQPDLVSREGVFQKIVQDVATSARAAKTDDLSELWPELMRLTLYYAADQTDLVANVRPNGPRYILAVAIEQTLKAVAAKPKRGKWKPTLTSDQVTDVVDVVLAHAVKNPQWVSRDELILIVLLAIFEALECIPRSRSLSYDTVRLLITYGLRAVSFRRQLVVDVITEQGKKKLVLTYSLEALFITLYDEQNQSSGTWTLSQTEILHAVLDSYLMRLTEYPAEQASIDEAMAKIKDAIEDLNNNLAFSIDNLIEDLES